MMSDKLGEALDALDSQRGQALLGLRRVAAALGLGLPPSATITGLADRCVTAIRSRALYGDLELHREIARLRHLEQALRSDAADWLRRGPENDEADTAFEDGMSEAAEQLTTTLDAYSETAYAISPARMAAWHLAAATALMEGIADQEAPHE